MEKSATAIELTTNQGEYNEWETFGNNVANDLKNLPAEKRRHAHCAIQKLLSEIHEGVLTTKLYRDIVDKAAVDQDSLEIQDIRGALEELITRLLDDEIDIEYEDEFSAPISFKVRCSYLQPCGSMAEKTTLWKSTRRRGDERKYIEFDNLVLLNDVGNIIEIRPGGCQGCRQILAGNRTYLNYKEFVESFLSAMYSRIKTRCSCDSEPNETSLENGNKTCKQCSVYRDTGYLQIAKVAGFNPNTVKDSEDCSLVLYWTSHTESLMAPNHDTLQLTERIKRLVIRVDILPAFEISESVCDKESGLKRFVISKRCPKCRPLRPTLMVSYCRYEWNAIHDRVSEKHRLTYSMLKFLYGQFNFCIQTDLWCLNSYHAKVAFLKHCETCTNDVEDCTRCLTDILMSLVKAYASGSIYLPNFHALKCLKLTYNYIGSYIFKLYVLSMISVVSKLEILAADNQCDSQYQLLHVVGIIKRTCLELLDGKLDIGDKDDSDGFSLRHRDNTVPSSNILVTLLENKKMVADFLEFGYKYEEYREVFQCRLHCPTQEWPLLAFRMTSIVKKIMSSNLRNITDDVVGQNVQTFQDYIKDRIGLGYKLLFLTSSQFIPEPLNTSSATPCVEPRVQTESIFTENLHINWPVVTAERLEKVSQKLRGIPSSATVTPTGSFQVAAADLDQRAEVTATESQKDPNTLQTDVEVHNVTDTHLSTKPLRIQLSSPGKDVTSIKVQDQPVEAVSTLPRNVETKFVSDVAVQCDDFIPFTTEPTRDGLRRG